MAGFMAGFGQAFSRSFEAGQERAHERRQDAFRVAYDNWANKRKAYEEDERAWKKSLDAGNLIAERYGAPKEAGIKAAEWLMAGYSVDDVDEMVRTTKFVVTPTVDEPDTPQDPTSFKDQFLSTVDGQMQESGLAEIPEITSPTEVHPQEEGVLGGLSNLFPNAGKSDEEKAALRLQETLGLTPEEFERTNQGFQRPQSPNIQMSLSEVNFSPLKEFNMDPDSGGINEAKFQAAQIEAEVNARSGDPVLEAKAARWKALLPDVMAVMEENVSPETKADILDMLKASQTARLEIGEKKASIRTAIENGKILADMVEQSDGMVLTTVAGGVSFLESLKTEADAFFNVLNQISGGDPNAPVSTSTLMTALDQVIGSGSVPDQVSQQYREFTAAAITYAYAMAQVVGAGKGRELSNQDFERVYKAIFTSNDKDAFLSSLKRSLNQQVSAVNNASEMLFKQPDIQGLLDPESKDPFMINMNSSLIETLGPLETWIQPEHLDWLKSAKAPDKEEVTPTTDTPTTKPTEKGFSVGERRRTKDGKVMMYIGGDPYDPLNWREVNSSGK